MRENIKKRALFVLKYLTGFILLGWILWRVDRQQMLATLTSINGKVLILVGMVALINLLAQFFRWKYLVESHSENYQARDLLPSFFAGFAFRLMLPGGHAEITKVFLLPGKKSGKVVAFSIEKFFQTYIKFILVLLALPLVFSEYRVALWSLAGLGMIGYFFLPYIWGAPFLKRFQEKKVDYARIFLRTLVYSLVIFACLILQYYVLLNDAHHISFWDTSLAAIFIWGAGLLPISISGLGVRENLAVYFLAQYGIPAFSAVGISLLIFFINAIIPALIGVLFILRNRKHLKDARGTIQSAYRVIYEQGRRRMHMKHRSSGSEEKFPQP